MVDDQPIGTSHNGPQGDAFMQDDAHENTHGNNFSADFSDPPSIMTMLQNMQLRQDERYEEDCLRQDVFEAAQVEIFMQEHMTA